ncbi:MFS transporter [Microvirga tunisiensis]|uniref:MFS transporter n=1 Tax=Pannonibacter tanglangensis TaxID=2750084 RepID=A0A7X5F5C4_9HYPH|nr:MFS transporter [Pannonibacter sp. XCT-53]NBN80058.1 MFS transporter [Pannonibacter sp. XCT-53]
MIRSAATSLRQSASGRHFITGLGIGQITSWGTLYYSFPLIGEAMGRDLGWSKAEVFLAATIGLLLAAPAAYPIGVWIDRGHGRTIMAGASVLAAAALLGWSQVSELWLFYALVGVLGVLQAAVLYEPAFAVVARRVGATQARNGITTLTFWGGFASTVFIPVVQILLDHLGWRGTLMALAAINLGIAALYALVIDRERDAAEQDSAREAVARRPSPEAGALPARPLRDAMRRPVFWLLGLAFTAYAATFSAFTFHLYPLLLEKGLTAAEVVTAMMMIGPAQVAGRLFIWRLAAGASVARIGCLVIPAFPLTLAGFELLPVTLAVALALVALYGLANGIMTIVRGMAVPEMLSREGYGALNGALALPGTLAKAMAPGAAALLWQASGSYDAVLGAAILGAAILVVSFWLAAAVCQREGQPG